MQVMSDLDDVFLPINRDQFFVDPIESRFVLSSLPFSTRPSSPSSSLFADMFVSCLFSHSFALSHSSQILRLLSSLPKTFADSPHPDAALGPAIQAALLSVARIGGQINVFQTSLPTFGAGALKPRDEPKLQHTDREKTLFVPQDIFWRNLAEECVDAGVGVNMFLFPNQYIDVATIGEFRFPLELELGRGRMDERADLSFRRVFPFAGILPAITGGDLFYLPKFEPVRMGGRLRAALEQVLLRETVSNATMIIRCCTGSSLSLFTLLSSIYCPPSLAHHSFPLLSSLFLSSLFLFLAGLRIGDQFGSFLQRSLTDLEFGTLDSDKAVAAYLIHEGTLDERIPASFQAAILHTSASGERRVRCINLQVPVTSLIGNVFR